MATNNNIYPKYFIEKVKGVYPNHSKIIELAENHSYELGTELNKEFSIASQLSYDYKGGNDFGHKDKLEEMRYKRKEIYEQWCRDYKNTCTQYIP